MTDTKDFLKESFGISEKVYDFCEAIRKDLRPQFEVIDEVSRYNQLKVLAAFRDNRISSGHLTGSSGYGYGDGGREVIDSVYAQVFRAEDALVRHNIISGTHALSLCLFGVLRPGDTVTAVTGKPYDTLEEVIGISGAPGSGSLKDFGINYNQIDLKDGLVDHNKIMLTLDIGTKAVLIQKSKGYDWRASLTNAEIGKIIKTVKGVNSEIICIVDNCYGEFAEFDEPTAYGADLAAGSLIKNPGGGMASTGGYVVGRKDLIEYVAYKLNSVGLGKEVGATLNMNKEILQGFFMAPHVVGESMKSAVFCGAVFSRLGFEVSPNVGDVRSDIIQAIKLGSEEAVVQFCRSVQKGAPIDSFVTPEPWDMPGYSHKVIMAAGAFNQGASIEFSADAPIKPPYIAYLQGGLTFDSAYAGIAGAVEDFVKNGIVTAF